MREENFERELDAALARYSAAEPRDGLEQRVLANLRAQDRKAPRFACGRWAAAVFSVASLAVLAMWAGGHSPAMKSTPISIHESSPVAGDSVSSTDAAKDLNVAETRGQSERRLLTITRAPAKRVARTNAGSTPKLAQFPAPEPLTEQEKLLVRFVEQDPKDAVLVAQETTERLRRESGETEGAKTDTSGEEQEQ